MRTTRLPAAAFVLVACLSTSHAFAAGKSLTVAADGTGEFKTVQAAVDAVPENNTDPVVISIKPGTYKEKITVPRDKPFVTFKGEDARTTVLTNDWNAKHVGPAGKEVGTSGSASVLVQAPDFVAENVTFENTAGNTGQAVALSAVGDRQVFRNCRMLGWQDTLYANGGRQYYDRCHIAGRVDFIFGNALAVFDHCEIRSRNGGHVTAASTEQAKPWGYVFLDCKLTGDPTPWHDPTGKLPPDKPTPKADLGRPWRPYASVTYVRCEFGEHIKPEGWQKWRKDDQTDQTARYAEYQCTGPGADRTKRVPWAKELTEEQADQLTVDKLLSGSDGWNPKR
jgi:pectinesterase